LDAARRGSVRLQAHLARKVREEKNRGKQQNLTDDEIAFNDALRVNGSVVHVLGNETLRKIATVIYPS